MIAFVREIKKLQKRLKIVEPFSFFSLIGAIQESSKKLITNYNLVFSPRLIVHTGNFDERIIQVIVRN